VGAEEELIDADPALGVRAARMEGRVDGDSDESPLGSAAIPPPMMPR
jgi:hypothetical protein